MKITEYVILESFGPEQMTEKVNEGIARGFQPCGNLVVKIVSAVRDGEQVTEEWCYQTMGKFTYEH